MMRNASCVENGMILLPVLFFTIAVAGIAGMAALSRRGALAEKRIHLEKTRALYLAHGGVAEALARVAGLSNDARPDGAAHTVNYDYGEAVFMITDTAGMLDVNIASETELHAAFREGGLEEPRELAATLANARTKGHGPPYWPLGSLDRLLLVPGVPPEIFLGDHGPCGIHDVERSRKNTKTDHALMDLLTVHGGSQTLSEAEKRQNTAEFLQGHTYRILSLGRSGESSVLFWVTARKVPVRSSGYIVLHRRVL